MMRRLIKKDDFLISYALRWYGAIGSTRYVRRNSFTVGAEIGG
jgi:hypothetical protein